MAREMLAKYAINCDDDDDDVVVEHQAVNQANGDDDSSERSKIVHLVCFYYA